MPALLLALLAAAAWAQPFTWSGISRIVAVGDVHADYPAFTGVLRAAGIIDTDANWAGGAAHLVQTGDVVDRGPDTRKTLDFLMALAEQARAAGGAVHVLVGNHEAMNLAGDLRYVIPADFAAFGSPNSERLRELYYREYLRNVRGADSGEESRRKWMAAHPPGFFERLTFLAPEGFYGAWIASNPVAIKINGLVFVHAGIGPKYAKMSLAEMNRRGREELADRRKLPGGMLLDPEGPLWYRGLGREDEAKIGRHVATVLGRLDARAFVIGHTTTSGYVTPRLEGKVVMIDVGLSKAYGSHPACLVVEGGRQFALHRGERLELPAGGGPELVRYVGRVEEIDRGAVR